MLKLMNHRMQPTITRMVQAVVRRGVHQSQIKFASRALSSSSSSETSDFHYDTSAFDNIIPGPPGKLTFEIAEGISDATNFYVKHGVTNQRLKALSQQTEMPAVVKWQKMMEVYLTTQVHVVAGLGYQPDQQGLTKFAHDLAQCMENTDDDMRQLLDEVRRDTWRLLVATTFGLELDEMKSLNIVDARNLMHKVSSKMVQPDVLGEIRSRCAALPDLSSDPEAELAEKHRILQHVIVHTVYLSGNPPLVEEAGFGSGEKAYAMLQCALSEYESDPLIAQYAGASMQKVWEAAGLSLPSPGNTT